MIYTVTLNPAVDYIVSPERFEKGEINRYSACTYGPGGKGVNVSLLLTSLGVENRALGVAAGFSGREIVRLLEEAGCETDFLFLPEGHSRINVKVCGPGGEETDINGDGPRLPPDVLDRLAEKLSGLGPEDALVLAGSLPRTLPADSYARLLKAAEGTGALTVVDACGEALLAALPHRPFLIKPNLEELSGLFGVPVENVAGAGEYAHRLQELGARNVIVSRGERGALLAEETGGCRFCRAVRGEAVSTVGAGDSLVAGFLYGWRLHGTAEGGLRWGVAAGAATAFSKGIASGDDVKRLYVSVGGAHPV